ncbi:MAG: methyltransferase protein [Phylliscum demangeonii]|nr:MAG: methyltransferase protein [Phylliscum demangeonii]
MAREEYAWKRKAQAPRPLDVFESWETWHVIRTVCKYNQRLLVALSLPRQLPPLPLQDRWYGEPLRLLALSGDAFLKNQGGHPVLSKGYQALIFRFMRLRFPPWILFCDVGGPRGFEEAGHSSASTLSDTSRIGADIISPRLQSPTPAEASTHPQQVTSSKKGSKDPTPHLSYVRYLQRNQPPRTIIERFGMGYQDYLQTPLQPLTDNLESVTYEVFEKDPVKYDLYERAITKALQDWAARGKAGSGPASQVVLAVVGAGRGPLVTRALQASVAAGVPIELWAVEKNPNAYVLLEKHNEDDWGGVVQLVKSDMRTWKGPWRGPRSKRETSSLDAMDDEDHGGSSSSSSSVSHHPGRSYGKVDILVSELLGSFGDNELSPECLDGVQHVLNPVHGISIPAASSAWLTPIATPRIHADIRLRIDSPTAFETPYVVMLQAYANLSTWPPPTHAHAQAPSSALSAPALPVIDKAWDFSHPAPSSRPHRSDSSDSNAHNARFKQLTFPCAHRGACHGLAGYFEATLWGDVELSTRPDHIDTKSPDMISWFPIFFPLKTPLYFPDHSELVVSVWRQTDDRRVWYEWLVEAFAVLPPHQPQQHQQHQLQLQQQQQQQNDGQRVRLACSELHSSVRNGCLM